MDAKEKKENKNEQLLDLKWQGNVSINNPKRKKNEKQ